MMAAKLRIRLYNILLGDAILVSVPDSENGKAKTRHILIDFGQKLNNDGSDKALFAPIYDDIVQELNGEPLDLYVMSHEHMDHNQGLLYVSRKDGRDVKNDLKVRNVWMTASAAKDYKERFPKSEKQKRLALAAFEEAERHLAAAPSEATAFTKTLLALNNPNATQDCVDFVRSLVTEAKTSYLHRGAKPKHVFEKAEFTIWGPEEDSSVYYGKKKIAPLLGAGDETDGDITPAETVPLPPPGVDAGAFYDLVNARMSGVGDNLLSIDKAANNTSLVFCLAWNGYKLLFPGDAEEKSWAMMDEQGVLEPVHFLKISHHASHNGTPDATILDKVLPPKAPDKKTRYAAVSTCLDAYPGIPHEETLGEIGKRVKRVYSTLTDSKPGKWVDVTFG
jgi:beta-lactamase superfamily II metal-dependent hydrolase